MVIFFFWGSVGVFSDIMVIFYVLFSVCGCVFWHYGDFLCIFQGLWIFFLRIWWLFCTFQGLWMCFLTLWWFCLYFSGSVEVFSDIMGAIDKEVLYVGDHIFGDILKSKKMRGWRTFLIVPELDHELRVWTEKQDLFSQLEQFDARIGELYR